MAEDSKNERQEFDRGESPMGATFASAEQATGLEANPALGAAPLPSAPLATTSSPACEAVRQHIAPLIASGQVDQAPAPLFRPEATGRRIRKLEGQVVLPIGPINRIGTPVVLVATFLLVLLAVMVPFPKRKSLTGWLVSDAGIVRVALPVGGTLERLYVQEGQKVTKGQRIATIRVAPDVIDGDYRAIQSGQFSKQGAALTSEGSARMTKLDIEAQEIERALVEMPNEILEAERRVKVREAAKELAQANLNRIQEVAAQGYFSKRDLATLQASLLAAESDVSDARANLFSLRRQMADTKARLRAIPLEKVMEAASQERGKAQLAGQLADQKIRTDYEVNAPADGVVAVTPAEFGRFLPAGATLSVVLLGNDQQRVHAELFAPTETASLLEKGQAVRLIFGASSAHQSSAEIGTVGSISLVPLSADEVPQRAGGGVESMYRVRVELNKQSAWIQHRDIRLLPGMQVNADVTVERSTLLQEMSASIAPSQR